MNNDNLQQQVRTLRGLLIAALRELDSLEAQLQAASPPPPPEEIAGASPRVARSPTPDRVSQQVRLVACLYLRGRGSNLRGYASSQNCCHSKAHPDLVAGYQVGHIEKDHQSQFCLTPRYIECPHFTAPVKAAE
jgi:hypothetical protein